MSGGNWKEMSMRPVRADLALVEYHVKNGVDLNFAHPEYLATPLVASILARQAQVALYLLDHGADPRLFSEFDGLTPMQAAQQVALVEVETQLRALGVEAPTLEPKRQSWLKRLLRKSAA